LPSQVVPKRPQSEIAGTWEVTKDDIWSDTVRAGATAALAAQEQER
jgi:hypothetical protein